MKGLQWVPNYERNRWFLVLQIEKPDNDGLNKLLHTINAVVVSLDHPTLYTEHCKDQVQGRVQKRKKGFEQHRGKSRGMAAVADTYTRVDLSSCFHISVAWKLDQPSDGMLKTLEGLMEENTMRLEFKVSTVKAKVGNMVTSWSLAARTESSNGII